MTVGNHRHSGKGAREEAAKALNYAVMSWRDDYTLTSRALYRGFEILSRGSRMKRFDGEPEVPELFVKGKETYRANLNADNPIGTIQSIEHTLRNFDKLADDGRTCIEREEKALADYLVQCGKAFDHEQRLKELLVRQAELNAALDLGKQERQLAHDATDTQAPESAHPERSSFVYRLTAETARVSAMAL